MSPRQRPSSPGSDVQGPAEQDELFVFSAWSLTALAKRYGSLERAARREAYLHEIGALSDRHPLRDWTDEGGLKLIDGADLEWPDGTPPEIAALFEGVQLIDDGE